MHLVGVPGSLIATAVRIFNGALALLAALDPLTIINSARCVAVVAEAMHEIIFPVAFILLGAQIVASRGSNRRECYLAMAVLNLSTIEEFPVANIQGAIDVFKSTESTLRCFLDRFSLDDRLCYGFRLRGLRRSSFFHSY